jgi:hypothetical protein
MSAEETAQLREELLEEERPESTDAAEEFLAELRRRGILEED